MTGDTADTKIAGLLSPIESRVDPFDSEHDIMPGLRVRPAPGHTPGRSTYVVQDGGERALLLGDTLHTVGEITEPEWFGLWDVDPVAGRAMRSRLVDELIASGDPFAPAHFPDLSFGRVVTADGLRRFDWI